MERNHLNKPVYRSKMKKKKKNKGIVKVMTNTRNSKRVNIKMVKKKDIKIIKYGEGKLENLDYPFFFFRKCLSLYDYQAKAGR